MSLQRFFQPLKRGDYMGAVGQFYTSPEANETLDFIQSLNVRMVRADAPLGHLEDPERLEQLAAYANACSRRRLYPVYIFGYVNRKDALNDHQHSAPTDEYIARLPKIAYKAGMKLIPLGVQIAEVWNEWNYDGFFNPTDVARYRRVLRAFHTGYHAAATELHQDVKVIPGGCAAIVNLMAPDAYVKLIGGMEEAALTMDGMALHCTDSSYDPDSVANRSAVWNSARVWPEKMRDIIAYIGRTKLCKVWNTEQGWFAPLNEVQAAQRFVTDMKYWFAQVDRQWAGPTIIYHAQRDGASGGQIDDAGSGAGLRRNNGSEKPIVAEVRRIASLDWTVKV